MRFALAPMTRDLVVLTLVCLAVPVILALCGHDAPPPIGVMLYAVSAMVAATYAAIWLVARPTAFVVDGGALEIVWPVRRRRIEASAITGARVLDRAQLRAELGRLVRVGAGGLFGGFGRARTLRGTFELWVSRTDRIVWVECTGRMPLLVTPDDPDAFVAELMKRR
ncbi:MAG TPA: PH domain-containing protein [Kofleriaceae bacterium]|nr:PH domain-containing protein [Kofleriaceae bacterium]